MIPSTRRILREPSLDPYFEFAETKNSPGRLYQHSQTLCELALNGCLYEAVYGFRSYEGSFQATGQLADLWAL